MKKMTISCCLMIAAMMGVTTVAQASSAMEGRTLSLFLFKFSEDGSGHPKPETNPVGDRANRRPLSGEIGASGVNIPGVDNSEIISFEIYTPSGFCMGIYSDEMDFIEALFSLSGEYEIRFVTDYAVFAGGIEI